MGCNRKKFGVREQILRQIVLINGAPYCILERVVDCRVGKGTSCRVPDPVVELVRARAVERTRTMTEPARKSGIDFLQEQHLNTTVEVAQVRSCSPPSDQPLAPLTVGSQVGKPGPLIGLHYLSWRPWDHQEVSHHQGQAAPELGHHHRLQTTNHTTMMPTMIPTKVAATQFMHYTMWQPTCHPNNYANEYSA